MVVKYNSLHRVEPPRLTLCNPGCESQDFLPTLTREIGVLMDCEAVELVLNFNSPSELNFRINQVEHTEIEDLTERHHVESLYYAVQNRRLIFAEMVGATLDANPRDEVGFFQITNVEVGFSDGHYYKDVTANSIEVEFQQWTVPYIEDGTYYFCEPEIRDNDIPALLDMIIDRVPLWKKGTIDSSLMNKQRALEDVDVSTDCLSFMLENMQETYDCLILFDPIERTVNAYSKDNYVRQTNIHITKDDVIESARITDNASDVCTALTVRTSEDVGISAVNPLGGNTIYDFSYYKSWMSPELAAAVTQWEYDVEHAGFGPVGAQTPFDSLVNSYFDNSEILRGYDMELERLNGLLEQYKRCRDNMAASGDATLAESNKAIVSYGGTPVTMQSSINATIAAINNLIAGVEADITAVYTETPTHPSYDSVKNTRDQMEAEIQDVTERLTPENYFRPNLLGSIVPEFSYEGIAAFDSDKAVRLTGGEAYEWTFSKIGTAASWQLYAAFFSADESHTRLTSGINGFFPSTHYDSGRGVFITNVTSSKSLVFTPSVDCDVMLGFYNLANQRTMEYPRLCARTNGTYDELIHYIFQGEYIDEYTVITDQMGYMERLNQMRQLLAKGKEELAKVSYPSEEFDIDVASVLFSEKFEDWDEQLETGCLINVDLEYAPNMIASRPAYTTSLITLDTDVATRLEEGETYLFSFTDITGATTWRPLAAFFKLDGTRVTSISGFPSSPNMYYNSATGAMRLGTTSRRSWMFTPPSDCYVMLGFNAGDTSASSEMVDPMLRRADGDVSALFLSTITVNYDDCNLNLTFGNKYNKYDPKSLFDKVLGNVTKTATDLSFVKSAITNIQDGQYDVMREAIEDSRNVTMRSALAAQNQQFVLDESGFTGRTYNPNDGTYSQNQIKITAENIIFTTDGWTREEGAATAIGHITWNGSSTYGINAQTLIGNLIIGQNLILSNNSEAGQRTMTFDQNGLTVTGDNFEVKLSPGSASIMTIKDTGTNPDTLLFGIDNGRLVINNETVRVAWNGFSSYIQLSNIGDNNPGVNIYSGASSESNPTQNLLMSMRKDGAWYYNNGTAIGKIGTNRLTGYPSHRGLVFDLETAASYMAWARMEPNAESYAIRLMYCPNAILDDNNNEIFSKGFAFADDVQMKTGSILYLTPTLRTVQYSNANELRDTNASGTLRLRGDGVVQIQTLQTAQTGFSVGYHVSGSTSMHPLLQLHRTSNTERYLWLVNPTNNTATTQMRLETGDIVTPGAITASAYNTSSDARLKRNIEESEVNAVELLNGVHVKSFDWIESGMHEDAGIIAQELRDVIPDAVSEDENTTVLSVDRTKLIPYLVKAVQELSAQLGMTKGATPTKRGAWVDDFTDEQKVGFVDALIQSRVIPEDENDELTEVTERFVPPTMSDIGQNIDEGGTGEDA